MECKKAFAKQADGYGDKSLMGTAAATYTGAQAGTAACLEYASMVLSNICHIMVDRQTLECAQYGLGDLRTLWLVAIDLTLIAQTGLRKSSREELAAFWREHGIEDTLVPMAGKNSTHVFKLVPSLASLHVLTEHVGWKPWNQSIRQVLQGSSLCKSTAGRMDTSVRIRSYLLAQESFW
jgi:hypothetical protein